MWHIFHHLNFIGAFLYKECFFTFVLSGEGTNCKGYQGHLDADWRDQVKEGLEDMKVCVK